MAAANIVQGPTREAEKLVELLESDIPRALGEATPKLALIHSLILRQSRASGFPPQSASSRTAVGPARAIVSSSTV